MKIKDYFLSQEIFELEETEQGILKLKEIPVNISTYYESDKYLSHNKNDKSVLSFAYQIVQKLNLKYKYKLIKKYRKEGKLLDYGCGNGVFLQFMKQKGFDVEGFEPNENAKNQAIQNQIKVVENIDTLEKYDIITLWHVLEHIENPEELLEKLKNKLTENGKLIIAIPNYESFDANYFKEYWAAWDVPRHIYHYSKNGAISFFRKNNFYIDNILPLPFDSYFISILSSQYKNSIFQKIMSPFIASISNVKSLQSGNWSSLIYVLKKNNF